MKKESTSARLKQIMNEQDLRQADILENTLPFCCTYGVKMNKSDISQYVSGKAKPNQDKLFVLSLALNVSEGWLMGFDVSRTRSSSPFNAMQLTAREERVIAVFRHLNDIDQEKLIAYGEGLAAADADDLNARLREDGERIAETNDVIDFVGI